MKPYHMRRKEKEITDRKEILGIIAKQKYLTLAMCRDNRPYCVTLNYGFDGEENCFLFHCAAQGKKVDFLKENPAVWCQIVEDRGYLQGECEHAYRSVHFRGTAEFVESIEEKKRALFLMIDQLEADPAAVKSKFEDKHFAKVAVGRIRVEEMSGKTSEERKDGSQ
ncbi:MAG: pyridoxamine 5'-phosphate oxidase family protein [Planctomycetota bacterium]|jgi:nitroimidazol reductase NimA-like FMN-containing flavoprotein (pyridoxamine 5'-phosphate oxidase superfamily)